MRKTISLVLPSFNEVRACIMNNVELMRYLLLLVASVALLPSFLTAFFFFRCTVDGDPSTHNMEQNYFEMDENFNTVYLPLLIRLIPFATYEGFELRKSLAHVVASGVVIPLLMPDSLSEDPDRYCALNQ